MAPPGPNGTDPLVPTPPLCRAAEGSRPDIRVAMREITLSQTPTLFGGEDNPPVTVYDPFRPLHRSECPHRPGDRPGAAACALGRGTRRHRTAGAAERSEEHTSELQSLMRNSYAVFCLKKK